MFNGHWGALENMIVDTCINIREGMNGLLVIVDLHHAALGKVLHTVKFEFSRYGYAIAER